MKPILILVARLACCLAWFAPGAHASPQLDQQAQALKAITGAPGVVVATFGTTEIDLGAAGVRKQGTATAITTDDQFHLGSLQKAMTSVTIATMVEAGQLSWNAPLTDLLPNLAASMHPAYRKKTLLDLLTHRAGIVGVLDLDAILALPSFTGTPRQQREQFAAWALQQTPDIAPGADAQYSNGGLTIAAAIAERIANQTYELLLTNRLLTPLQIPPRFQWPAFGAAAVNLTQPWGHTFEEGEFVPNDPNAPEFQFPQFLNPAGNITMTVHEYVRTVRLHLRGLRGQCQILTPQTYQFLNTPQSSLQLSPAWFVDLINGESTSSFAGSAGTFYVYVAIQPRLNKGVVIAINAVEESATFDAAVLEAATALLALPAQSVFDDRFEGCN